MAADFADEDIEQQYNSRSVAIKPEVTSCCGIGAIGAVGKLANLIRMIVCISLIAATVLLLLIAAGIFTDFLVSSKILYANSVCENRSLIFSRYFLAVVAGIGAICVAFDSATSQWLVQKVLNQLSSDVLVLERSLKVLNGQLEEGRRQLDDREAQLKESAEQIVKQRLIISDMTLVQHNMGAL